jgi:hypothetical protein
VRFDKTSIVFVIKYEYDGKEIVTKRSYSEFLTLYKEVELVLY